MAHAHQGCPGDTPTDDESGQVVAGPPAECGDGCTVITRRAGIVEPCGRPCGRRQPHLGRPATCMCTGHLRTHAPSTSSSDADAMAPVTGGDCSHAFEVPGTGHLTCGCVRGDHPTVGGADAFASAGDGATGVSAAFDAGRPSSGQGTAPGDRPDPTEGSPDAVAAQAELLAALLQPADAGSPVGEDNDSTPAASVTQGSSEPS